LRLRTDGPDGDATVQGEAVGTVEEANVAVTSSGVTIFARRRRSFHATTGGIEQMWRARDANSEPVSEEERCPTESSERSDLATAPGPRGIG
jgi:hypothetical protein